MSSRRTITALAVLAAGAFFWLLVGYPQRPQQIHELSGHTMGTTWSVQVLAREAQMAQQAGTGVQALLTHLDREVFSTWEEQSELSRLNQAIPGTVLPVSAEMLHVLVLAKDVYRRSRNTFDISVGPLVNLWGFGPSPAAGVPDAAAIAEAQAQLGLDALQVDTASSTVTLTRMLSLDLSGIAKGYAVDAVAALLRERGFSSFVVEIGGELVAQGSRPDGSPWVIAIERPQDGPRMVQARLSVADATLALAGSGDYRNYYESGGQRFSHEIDPRTGRPVNHNLTAVTVAAASAAEADAWATALMVLGPEEGHEVADVEGLAAYFIMRTPSGLLEQHTAAMAPYLQP